MALVSMRISFGDGVGVGRSVTERGEPTAVRVAAGWVEGIVARSGLGCLGDFDMCVNQGYVERCESG